MMIVQSWMERLSSKISENYWLIEAQKSIEPFFWWLYLCVIIAKFFPSRDCSIGIINVSYELQTLSYWMPLWASKD